MASEMLESYVEMIEAGMDADTTKMLIGEIASFIMVQEGTSLPPPLVRRLHGICITTLNDTSSDEELWRTGVTLAQAVAKNGEASGSMAAMLAPAELVTAMASKIELAITLDEKPLADGMFGFLRVCSRCTRGHYRRSMSWGDQDSSSASSIDTALATAACSLISSVSRLRMDRVHVEKALQLAADVVRSATHDSGPAAAITTGFAAQAGTLMFSSNPSIAEASGTLLHVLLRCAIDHVSSVESSISVIRAQLANGEGVAAKAAGPASRFGKAGSDSSEPPKPPEVQLADLAVRRSAGQVFLAQVVGVTASLVVAALRGAGDSDDAIGRVLVVSELAQGSQYASKLFARAAARVGLRDAVCKGIASLAGQSVTAASREWAAVRFASQDVIKLAVLDGVISASDCSILAAAVHSQPSEATAVRSHAVGAIAQAKTLLDLATSLQRADADASAAAAGDASAPAATAMPAAVAVSASASHDADVEVALFGGCDACQASLEAMTGKTLEPSPELDTAEAFRSALITSLSVALSCSPVLSLLAEPLVEALNDAIYGAKPSRVRHEDAVSSASHGGAASASSEGSPLDAAEAGGVGEECGDGTARDDGGEAEADGEAAVGAGEVASTSKAAGEAPADTRGQLLVVPAEFVGALPALSECVAAAMVSQQAPLAAYFLDFAGARPKDDAKCVAGLRCMYALLWHCDAYMSAWMVRLGVDYLLRAGIDTRPAVKGGVFTRPAPDQSTLWCWRVTALIESKLGAATPALADPLAERAAAADDAWVALHPEGLKPASTKTVEVTTLSSSASALVGGSIVDQGGSDGADEDHGDEGEEADEQETFAKLADVPGFGQLSRRASSTQGLDGELAGPAGFGDRQTSAASATGPAWDAAAVLDALAMPTPSFSSIDEAACQASLNHGKARLEDMLDAQRSGATHATKMPLLDPTPAATEDEDLNAIVITPEAFSAYHGSPLISRMGAKLVGVVDELVQAAAADRAAVRVHGLASDEAVASFWGCVGALATLRTVLQPPAVITGSEFVASKLPMALAVLLRVTPLDGIDAALQAADATHEAKVQDDVDPAKDTSGHTPSNAVALMDKAASPSLDSLLGARRLQAVALVFGGASKEQLQSRLRAAMPDGLDLPADVGLATLVSLTQFAAGEQRRGCWDAISHRGVFAEPSHLAHFGKHMAVFELRPVTRTTSILVDRAVLAGATPEEAERVRKAAESFFGTFRISVPLTATARHVEQRLIACLSRWAAGTVTDIHGRLRLFGRLALGAWEGRGIRPLRLRLEWASPSLQAIDARPASLKHAASAASSGEAGTVSCDAPTLPVVLPAAAVAQSERLLAVHAAAGGVVVYVVLRHAGSDAPYVAIHIRSLVACTSRVWLAVGSAPDGFVVETGAAHDVSGRLVSPDERSVIAAPRLPCTVPALSLEPNAADELGAKLVVTSTPSAWSQVVRLVLPPGGMLRDVVAFLPSDTKAAAAAAAAAAATSASGTAKPSAAASAHGWSDDQPKLAPSVLMAMHMGTQIVEMAQLQWAWKPVTDAADDLTTWPEQWPTPVNPDTGRQQRSTFAGRGTPHSNPYAPMGRGSSSNNMLWVSDGGLTEGMQEGLGAGAYAGTLSKARCLADTDAPPGTKVAVYGDMDMQAEGPAFEGMLVTRSVVARVVRLSPGEAGFASTLPTGSGCLRQPFCDGLTSSLATRRAVAAATKQEPSATVLGRSFSGLDLAAGHASPCLNSVSTLPEASAPPSTLFLALPGVIKQVRAKAYGTGSSSLGGPGRRTYHLLTIVIADPRRHVPDRAGLPLLSLPGSMATSLLPADAKALSDHANEAGSVLTALRSRARRGSPRRGGSGGSSKFPASAATSIAAKVERLLAASMAQVGPGVLLEPSMERLREEMGVPIAAAADAKSRAATTRKAVLPGSILESGGHGKAGVVLPASAEALDEEIALAEALGLPVRDSTLAAMKLARDSALEPTAPAAGAAAAGTSASRPLAFRVLLCDGICHNNIVTVRDLDGKFGAPGTVFIHSRQVDEYGSSITEPHSTASAGDAATATDSTAASTFHPAWFSRLGHRSASLHLPTKTLNCFRHIFRSFASVPLLPVEHEIVEACLAGERATSKDSVADVATAGTSGASSKSAMATMHSFQITADAASFIEGRSFLSGDGTASGVDLEEDSRPILSLGGKVLVQPSGKALPRAISGADFVRLVEALSGPCMSATQLDKTASRRRSSETFQRFGRSYALAVVEACSEHGTELPAFAEMVQSGLSGTGAAPSRGQGLKHLSHAGLQRLARSLASPEAMEFDSAVTPPTNAFGVHYRPMLADAVMTEVDFIAFYLEAIGDRRGAVIDDLASLGISPSLDGFISPFCPGIRTSAVSNRLDRGWSIGLFDDAHTLRAGGTGSIPADLPTSGRRRRHSGPHSAGAASDVGYGGMGSLGIDQVMGRGSGDAMIPDMLAATGTGDGGGGGRAVEDMSEEEMLALAMAASLEETESSTDDAAPAAVAAAQGVVEAQEPDDTDTARANTAPEPVELEPAAAPLAATAAPSGVAAAAATPGSVIAAAFAELHPAPPAKRFPSNLARLQGDLALRDAASGAGIDGHAAMLQAHSMGRGSGLFPRRRRPMSNADAAAVLAVGEGARDDPTGCYGSLSLSSLLEGAELLHVRSEAIASGSHAGADASAPPLPYRAEHEAAAEAVNSAEALAAAGAALAKPSAQDEPVGVAAPGTVLLPLPPVGMAEAASKAASVAASGATAALGLAASESVWEQCCRLLAEVVTFERAPAGGAWLDTPTELPSAVDEEEDADAPAPGSRHTGSAGADAPLAAMMAAAAGTSSQGSVRRAIKQGMARTMHTAMHLAATQPSTGGAAARDFHDGLLAHSGVFQSSGEDRDGMLSRSMKDSRRHAEQMERSKGQAPVSMMPAAETAAELDVFAVEQVLARVAMACKPVEETAPSSTAPASLECAAVRSHGPASGLARRMWGAVGTEDEEAVAFLSPDDVLTPEATTALPRFVVEVVEVKQMQTSAAVEHARYSKGEALQRAGEIVDARAVLVRQALEEAFAVHGDAANDTNDAALARAVLAAAVGPQQQRANEGMHAPRARPPAGASTSTGRVRRLHDTVSVCTRSNAASLLRPENLVMGLAQRPRLLINGRAVDSGCSVYAMDTYAVTLPETVPTSETKGKSGAPFSKDKALGIEAWKLGGVPVCLVTGSSRPETTQPKPETPPAAGYVGCYVAVDWSRSGPGSRWYGGVVRAAVGTASGVVHVIDFDDGDSFIINLETHFHEVVALPGTFGHTAEEDAAAAASCPVPRDASSMGGWHRLGSRSRRVAGAGSARREIVRILSDAGISRFSQSSRFGYGHDFGRSRAAAGKPQSDARPVHVLHYDLDATVVRLHERSWAADALGADVLAMGDAGRGALGFGPLVAAMSAESTPAAQASVISAAAVSSASGNTIDVHASVVMATMAQASAATSDDQVPPAGVASAAPAAVASPTTAAAACGGSGSGSGRLEDADDDAERVLLPVSLLVDCAKVDAEVCATMGLPADSALPPSYPLYAELRIRRLPAPSAKEGAATSNKPAAEHSHATGMDATGHTWPVLLSGGDQSLTTAFCRAAAAARLSRVVARGSPVVPLCQPSMLRADANLLDAGSNSHDSILEAGVSRVPHGMEVVSRAFPRHAAAVAAHGPWMDLYWASSSDKAVGDALAVLRIVGSLAESLSESHRSQSGAVTATDASGIAYRVSSEVVDPALFAVRGAASACSDQMSDNVALAYGCLPRWLGLAPATHPQAIPFPLRRRAFFYLAFGPTRRMLAVQDELGEAKPGDTPERAAARARTRDNDPERILPTQVKAVASRSQLLRSARAIFRWWCAPVQRFQRASALVRKAQLMAQTGSTAASIPWSAPPLEEGNDARAAFRTAMGEVAGRSKGRYRSHEEIAEAVAIGALPSSAASAAMATDLSIGLGPAAVPAELALPLPPLSHDCLGRRKAVLNVSFDGEDAHGSGVTREFYTLVMRELRDKRLGLWCDQPQDPDSAAAAAAAAAVAAPPPEPTSSRFVFAPRGLFPAPLPADADSAARVIDLMVLAGRATAKALEDGHRDIDVPISEAFAKLVLGEPATLRDVAAVEPDMEATTRVLEGVLRAVEQSETHGDAVSATWAREQCDMLGLTWAKGSTPLVPGGDDIIVTVDNVRGFCRALVHSVVVAPAIYHATAFRYGFAGVADVSRLRMFTAAEFVAIISDVSTSWASQAHLWEPEAIRRELTFHDSSQFRFERDDPTITAFVEALSALSPVDKRLFLEFATASPRLPENGFAGLRPRRLQVNRRIPKAGRTADDEAIFCRVCTSELSLPAYSSIQVLRSRLHEAIHSIADGLGGFRQHA